MLYLYLFATAFLSATFFPLGSEALLIFDLEQKANPYLLLIFATLGNTLGSTLNYYFGFKGEEFLIEKKMIKKEKIDKLTIFFSKYGGYSLWLSWVPIIGDPITFMAGLSRYSFKKFLFIVLMAKMSRYIFIILGWYYWG